MSFVEEEIASQPACWRRAAALATRLSAALPAKGRRVAILGCGTSWFVAQAMAALREATGHGETDAFAASEVPDGRHYDSVITLSRSGTTSEVLAAAAAVEGSTTVAITADGSSPLAAQTDRAIVLDFANEQSVVQTRFATTVLALLRAHLGHALELAAVDAEDALEAPLPETPSDVAFLGTAWRVGLAREAGLKVREAAALPSEAHPAMEYRHGPISVAGPGTLVWAIGPVDASVLADAAGTGATIAGEGLDPMAELVLIQRMAVDLAEAHGLDPDRPKHLTRSVVLP